MQKTYINAQTLLNDSFELAVKIIEGGFLPDLIVGVWRGGSPIAIAIHEAMDFVGISCDHIAIKTRSYTGIAERSEVEVNGLEYLSDRIHSQHSILLVDDVFDTGLSLDKVIHELDALFKGKPPLIKIAVPYFKPENNQTNREPDFYLHKSSNWLVFPHEIQGLSDVELLEEKPDIATLKRQLLKLRRQ